MEVRRMRRLVRRFGREGLTRVFTVRELDYAYSSSRLCCERLAARLAAKEAFIKAWGTPVPLRHLEVVKREGVPFIHYAGSEYPLSLSHTKRLAIAVAVLDSSARAPQGPQAR